MYFIMPLQSIIVIVVTSLALTFCAGQSPVSKESNADINAKCQDSSIATCKECILAHPQCAWCATNEPGSKKKRCKSNAQFLEDNDCPPESLNFPRNVITNTEDKDFSKPGDFVPGETTNQLKPQKIELKLRKGETAKFNVTFRKVNDYPVDLYYVMDLSYSMKDDLKVLQKLGRELATELGSITKDMQLGFGTFVDKVMMPFASTVTEQLKNPCVKNEDGDGQCAPPFGFKHQQKISAKVDEFIKAVNSTKISGNIDSPEGGFDALMQIAVCKDKIGWRDEATHLVVFTTDDSFHMALDGKLAAIFDANDMQCHLELGANPYLPEATVYSKSKELDYPSIGQLRTAFLKNKIQPIFAVTKGVIDLYKDVEHIIESSYVSELAEDSGNIIQIIRDAYGDLKSKLEMNHGQLKHGTVTSRVRCPGETEFKTSLKCGNIQIGTEAFYEFEVTSDYDCSEQEAVPSEITFTSNSLGQNVVISVKHICECDCAKDAVLDGINEQCNSNGSLVCGACQCNPGREGVVCQCSNDKDVKLTEHCKKQENGGVKSTAEICEGHGACLCGVCECEIGWTGTYCECSTTSCSSDNDGICGGADKGECRDCDGKGICTCKGNWTLDTAGAKTCKCNKQKCIEPGSSSECNGQGDCECNECVCHQNSQIWSGEFCSECNDPSCKETKAECDAILVTACASCVHDAQLNGNGIKDSCAKICEGLKFQTTEAIPDCTTCKGHPSCHRLCKNVDPDKKFPRCKTAMQSTNCEIKYEVMWDKFAKDYLLVVKQYNKEEDCEKPTDPILYVLPIIAGIVLLGLAALGAWKIYQTIRDKKEWENFEKEMKQSRWTKDINPMFVNPSAKFENPSYGGDI